VSSRSKTGLHHGPMTMRPTQQSTNTNRCITACAGSSTHAVDLRDLVLQAGDGVRVGFPAAVFAVKEPLRAAPHMAWRSDCYAAWRRQDLLPSRSSMLRYHQHESIVIMPLSVWRECRRAADLCVLMGSSGRGEETGRMVLTS